MAREVPAAPKVYTTTYDNFKGVDFTNDATNVWRRRSPTGVNMLPDESGRPFKRHGWNILISNSDLCGIFGKESCAIEKCAYFELAGVDHIVVFTNVGVAFYADGEFTAINTEPECYTGYDRSFFFEGNGTAAFYIYGNFRVWRYSYNNGFVFEDVTDEITIPTVLIAANANCAGTIYNGYNLLGTKARVEYNDISLFEYWCSDGLTVKVDDSFIEGKTRGNPAYYQYEYDGSAWSSTLPTGVEVIGEPKENDIIVIVFAYGVMLPNNVTRDQIDDVKVSASKKMQFDWNIETTNTDGGGDALLHPDPTGHRAWIEFTSTVSSEITEVVSGEDFLRVEFPSNEIVITPYNDLVIDTTANLVGA